jgi:hypothetical protein
MYPDYNAMVNEFIRPVVSILLFAFLILGWLTAFMLMKENTILRIKLGKEDARNKESFKFWFLRRTAPVIYPIYSVKSFLNEKQFQPFFKRIIRKNNKVLRMALRLNIVTSIVATVFGLVSSRTNWGIRK